MWHLYLPQDSAQIPFRGFPNDNHHVSSHPSNNKFSLLAYSPQLPHPVLGESDIQFGESNVSKKSIHTPESSRHAPSNSFLGFSRIKWYFLLSVISLIRISHFPNVYKGEIHAFSYWKYFCVQTECVLVCTMTLQDLLYSSTKESSTFWASWS